MASTDNQQSVTQLPLAQLTPGDPCLQVSNFQGASEPAGEEFITHIADKLTEQKCLLDVVSIDMPDDGSDPAATEIKNINSDTLAQVCIRPFFQQSAGLY